MGGYRRDSAQGCRGKNGRAGLNEGHIANTASINSRIYKSIASTKTTKGCLLMSVFALISTTTKGDDENNYTIRMTDEGMMTAAFSYILVV